MEARSTKQARGSQKQIPSSETISLAVNVPRSSTNTCRSNFLQGPENTQAITGTSPTFFAPPGPEKKKTARSKKHVQVQKKGAQVQKTCIPKEKQAARFFCTLAGWWSQAVLGAEHGKKYKI